MSDPKIPRTERFALRVATWIVLINLVAILLAGISISEGRDQALERAGQLSRNFSQVLEHDLSISFDRIDFALLSVKDELERQMRQGDIDSTALSGHIRRQLERQPLLRDIRVSDPQGQMRWASTGLFERPFDVHDREYFTRARDLTPGQLVISQPLRRRLSGEPAIVLVRRYDLPGGRFGGIVAASLGLTDIQRLFSTLDVGSNGTISLREFDLNLVVRHPPFEDASTTEIPIELRRAVVVNPSGGTFVMRNTQDGIERTQSFLRFSHYPYFMIVGLDTREYLADWQRESARLTAVVLAFVLATTLAGVLVVRGWQQREENLRLQAAEQAKLAQLAEQVPGMLFQMRRGRDGTMQLPYVSDAIRDMFELEPEQVRDSAQILLQRIDPEDLATGRRLIETSARLLQGWNLDYRVRLPRQGLVWRRTVAKPQLLHDGSLLWHGFCSDITTERRAAEERAALENQLMQSQKMDALGQLTGGIAHDFNNMLSSILGYAQLSLDRFAGPPQGKLAQYLSQILQAGERGRALVSRMLSYSRTQPARAAHAIDIGPVLEEALDLLKPTIPAGIRLQSFVTEGVRPVRIDPVELQQVLMNLLINARDAIGEHGSIDVILAPWGGERVGPCSVCQESAEGPFVELCVHDSGGGIAADVLPRIFDPFFSTKGAGRGTGLGLSMVQGIVRRVAGHLFVESEVGRGTSFRLLLPASTADARAEPDPARKPAHARTVAELGHPEDLPVVWVVDDSEPIVAWMQDLLEGEGFAVRGFTEPAQLLEAFRRDPQAPAVVISDQTMPDLSGAELARELLNLRPTLAFLLCTGYSESINEESARALGIRALLRKPVPGVELIDAIDACLEADASAIFPATTS